MSDSDWQDPFAEDEAARERARRRAEREARRRERGEAARRSLGERVREGIGTTPDEPAQTPPPAPARPAAREEPPAAARPRPAGERRARALAATTFRRRRAAALIGLGLLAVAGVAVAAVVLRDGGEQPVAAPPRERPTVSVTVPEGLSRSQVARVARRAGLRGDYERATRSARGFNLRRYDAQGADSLEGFLFPATYEVFRRAPVRDLVEKQLEAFEQNFSGLDLREARRAGLSAYDVVIVASMIEREIAIPEERELAASVIYNRLEAGTPLGIDATIRFEDQNWDEPLVQSRLEAPTPYNTRVNPGLPPGPIGNPGLASLEAAANPAETDYFYYVIKPGTCNEHTFVETEEEFAQAEAAYQEALQARGGSPTDC